jgi:hypothetical protein
VGADGLRPSNQTRWGIPHAIAAYLTGLLLGNVLFAFAGGDPAASTTTVTIHVASVIGLWIGFIGGPIAATRWFGSRSLRDDFGLTMKSRDVPVGLLAGALTQLVLVPVVSWPVEQLWSIDVDEPTRQLLDNTMGSRVVLYLVIVVGAPIAEELFFRGLLLRSLARRFDDVAAIVVSALVFSLTHFKPAQIPGLFVVGTVFAVLTRRTGRPASSRGVQRTALLLV